MVELDLREEVDSTNEVLLRLLTDQRHGRVVLAERQTAGKGRRGRRWQSPPGNIWLSIGWRFETATSSPGALALVAGVCVCRALARVGLRGHGVKWPNDVQVAGCKLGGILVELRGGHRALDAVVGIGINVDLGAQAADIEQPVTDLASHLDADALDRNAIVAAVLDELLDAFRKVHAELASFLETEWPEWDLLRGEKVRVVRESEVYEGHAEGIAADGALKLSVDASTGAVAGLMTFHSGEASLRRA